MQDEPGTSLFIVRVRQLRRFVVVLIAMLTSVVVLAVLVMNGVLWFNRLPAAGYDTRGIDVSHHNGTIDWRAVADQDVDFAFIKATEGSGHVDKRFAENWEAAKDAGLTVGAYHFMSFESSGAGQAENLLATVPAREDMLPPVVDLEPYGEFAGDLPPAHEVRAILDPLLAAVEAEYGRPAIIYTTSEAYDAYLVGGYEENPLWFRSVLVPPRLSDGREWTIWQYSDHDRLDGVGTDPESEPYVDMNVLRGTLDELVVGP